MFSGALGAATLRETPPRRGFFMAKRIGGWARISDHGLQAVGPGCSGRCGRVRPGAAAP